MLFDGIIYHIRKWNIVNLPYVISLFYDKISVIKDIR